MKKFKLSKRSLDNLALVHVDLMCVVKRAIEITDVDFVVIEGLRTEAKQRRLVAAGASQTMNSRHLTGHAVDLAAWVGGQVRWDWPLYAQIADAMLSAARELNVPIVWGGHWKSFRDGPHFELDRKRYPA
jgi:peptidoglycan L-alanyl-D-glutamate endopeptidase CwlK